jgi:hypothetical protein
VSSLSRNSPFPDRAAATRRLHFHPSHSQNRMWWLYIGLRLAYAILAYPCCSKVFLRMYGTSRLGHRRAREHPQAGLCQGPCYLSGRISVKHLYWCTWLNLRQGWHMQSSNIPTVSFNTHRYAPTPRCCEQIAEYWGRLSRPQASLGQFFFPVSEKYRESGLDRAQ